MKKLYYATDICDWCFDEAQAPHAETLEALGKAVHPGGWNGNDWMYQPYFMNLERHAALTAKYELIDTLLAQARGPAVTIELEFSGEEGSLTLCARHVAELLAGIQGIEHATIESSLPV